jgi:hypothetical protein
MVEMETLPQIGEEANPPLTMEDQEDQMGMIPTCVRIRG